MLKTYESNKGPGTCRCYRCGVVLREATLTIDRIVPGCLGGRYTRDNIRPACLRCNSQTGVLLRHRQPKRRIHTL